MDCRVASLLAMTKRVAFTLAEVLITLGVIGVVAAITIPDLVKKYQYTAWTKQLQKSYATLNQGFRRMLAEENADRLSQTETFNSIDEHGCAFYLGTMYCKDFFTNLGKYFKIASRKSNDYDTYYLNGSVADSYTGGVITLMDGTIIRNFYFLFYQDQISRTNNRMKGSVGQFYLDINGTKRPNKFGRDIFCFYLGDNGIVYPLGSQAVSELFLII